ncbi:MAG TPA: hypothetical protein DDX98_14080 [Bacteroidales bacterium]|jgi:hypothetical protein|nr:hypothetical protein [Bacteroidales bacterium]
MIVLQRVFFIVSFFFIFIEAGYPQAITIETKMDTNKISLGEPVELKYIVNKNTNDVILLPEFSDTLIVGVEVLDSAMVDSFKLKKDKEQLEQRLVITSFEEGKHYIPPQAFALKLGTITDTIYSKPSYLEVVGVAIDTTGTIRDIADVERAPVIFRDFIPLFVLLGMVLIALAIVYFVRQRRKGKGLLGPAVKAEEPAHIIALRELDKLKAQKLWQQEQLKEYYSRLTAIVRTYIENKFGILAMEMPSSEILIEVKNIGLDKLINLKEFEGLLNLADSIKFAKGHAQPDENIVQLENAYKLVKATYKLGEENEEENNPEKTEITE